jgi:hypothetical protein
MGENQDGSLRYWSRVLPAGPMTAAEARWFLREALTDVDVAGDIEDALLLTSEVASNAVRDG